MRKIIFLLFVILSINIYGQEIEEIVVIATARTIDTGGGGYHVFNSQASTTIRSGIEIPRSVLRDLRSLAEDRAITRANHATQRDNAVIVTTSVIRKPFRARPGVRIP